VRHAYALLVLLSISVNAVAGDSSERRLSLTFTPDTVVVSGGGRSHEIVLLGIGISRFGRAPLLTRELLTQSGIDGDVTFTPRQIPERSIWIAVDVNDGSHGMATPSGAAPPALQVGDNEWRGGRADVDIAREYLEVLLVRPGTGAWALRASEGGSKDADGRHDGVLKLRLANMERIAGEAGGPPVATPRDLLIAVDPQTLQYFIREAR